MPGATSNSNNSGANSNSNGEALAATDAWLCGLADAVPVPLWGFDETVNKLISDRKHELMDTKMTAKQLLHMSKRRKRQLIRTDRSSNLNTVTDVWKLMTDKKIGDKLDKQQSKKAARKLAAAEKKAASAKRAAPNSVKNKKSKKEKKEDAEDETLAGNGETSGGSTLTRDEAIVKLQAKLAEMRAARTPASTAGELQDLARVKRRISKLKLKTRKASDKSAKNAASKLKPESATSTKSETKAVDTKSSTVSSAARASNDELIRNEEGKLVFNKFDFALSAGARAALQQKASVKKKSKKAGAEKLTGKDHKRLLDKVEARQRKLDKWKAKDPEKAARLEQNIKWSDAMQRADGAVVKNEPEKLKQSLKNKEKMKEVRQKKWAARGESVQQQQQQKQDKRKTNIKKRKDEKINRKLNRAAKRR